MINNSAALLALILAACGARAAAHEGYQGVVEHEEWILGFEVAGRVTAVPVKRGEVVAAGAVLAKLDDSLAIPSRDARAAEVRAADAQLELLRAGARPEDVRAARAQLRGARERVAQLESNLARQRVLEQRGASGPALTEDLERDLARAQEEVHVLEQRVRLLVAGARPEELAAAQARAEGARAALAAEEQRLRRHTLTAGAAGVVVGVHVEPGEIVGAGTPVVSVADTHHPYVDVFVPSERVTAIRVGDAASARVDGLPDALPGRVEDIGRRTEFTPRFVFSPRERPNLVIRVRVRVDDPEEKLRAGLPAFVSIP